MLLKMVLNNNDNTRTLFWSDRPADVMSRNSCDYCAEIANMLDHGVITYKNARITAYAAPTENRGCNDYENTARCIEIANELDTIAGGYMIRCPECGEIVSMPYEEGEGVELGCGCKVDIDDLDDLDEVTMWDYLEDNALDIKYTINSDLSYKAARVLITFGGPNIYIDTNSARVELFWGSSEASAALPNRAVDAIDAYFEDDYNNRRSCL